MKRPLVATAAAVTSVLALSGGASADPRGATAESIRLADATMIVEVNATDGDAGLQVFLDGEAWKTMRVTGPNGRTILDVTTKGRLDGYGLTELFSESSEPPFDVFPLEKFRQLFPAGKYTFAGRTIEGAALTGSARLSHEIPAGPKILSPVNGVTVSREGLIARWAGVPSTGGIDIVGYRAIVTREDPFRVLSVDLPAIARKVRVPVEFLERRTEYKLEVQAIEQSGNQTLTEVSFRVR